MIKKIVALVLLLLPLNFANAVPRIDITKGNLEPLPIAINNFSDSSSASDGGMGHKITGVIQNDLGGSGLFKIIHHQAFIERLKGVNVTPEFASWRQINAAAVVAGSVVMLGEGKFKIEYKAWDSFSQQQICANDFIISYGNWRKAAHKIADEIYTAMTGDSGYFNTKIAFVVEYGDPFKKTKRLALMDQDGANLEYLTDGKNLVLTPRFSPDNSKVIYLSFEKKTPKVFIYDLRTKSHHLLGKFQGMSFAPKFSPDGRYVVMSVAKDGVTDIYKYDLLTKQQTKLTNGPYIDTSPSFSPDGKQITFNSDRGGQTQLYVMNADGSDQKRISFAAGSYFTPVWSPRGDYIAFTKKIGRNFHIGVMRTDGSGERLLTEGYMVESPSWAPNGRVLIFARGEENTRAGIGKTKLQTIDITGYNEKDLKLPVESSDPFWSNLLN